jgi:hypothetical protein
MVKLWFWRLLWHRLFIRKDEFHPSLNIDVEAVSAMDSEARKHYFDDLARRRKIAHERSLA